MDTMVKSDGNGMQSVILDKVVESDANIITDKESTDDTWLTQPVFKRQPSCSPLTIVHPCVNKYETHLELLQNAIMTHLAKHSTFSEVLEKDVKKDKSLPSSMSSVATTMRLLTDSSSLLDEKEPSFSVIPLLRDQLSYTIPRPLSSPLVIKDIVTNVISLMRKMELDRRITEDKIDLERRKFIVYSTKIDRLACIRMEEIPRLVQREHDRSVADINEMQWHVDYSAKRKVKLLKRFEGVKSLNTRLKEELEHIDEYRPLVEDKLLLEMDTMARIEEARRKTQEELELAKKRLLATIERKEDTVRLARQERDHFANEIKKATKQYEAAKLDLSKAETLQTKLETNVSRNQTALDKLTDTIGRARARLAGSSQKLEGLETRIDRLDRQIHDAVAEHRWQDNLNRTAREEQDRLRDEQHHQLEELTTKTNDMGDKSFNISRKNKELEVDAEQMIDKMAYLERQSDIHAETTERIHRNLVSLRDERNEVMDQLWKVKKEHGEVKDRLQEREDAIMAVEDELVATRSQLEYQVETDRKIKTSLRERISTGTVELAEERKVAKERRGLTKQLVIETEKELRVLRKEVAQTKEDADNQKKQVAQKMEDLQNIKLETTTIQKDVEESTQDLAPLHRQVRDAFTRVERQLEYMDWQRKMMTKKLEENQNQAAVVNRGKVKTEVEVTELESRHMEVTIQKKKCDKQEAQLKENIERIDKRLQDYDSQHQQLIMDRRQYMTSLNHDMNETLQKNSDQAGNYRRMQAEYYALKEGLLDVQNIQILYEVDVRDLKQIRSLQSHLHHEENQFLRKHEAYYLSQLAQYQVDANWSSKKLHALNLTLQDHIKKLENVTSSVQIHS